MNRIKILSCMFLASTGLFMGGKQAIAAPVTIACGTAIDDYFSGRLPGARLEGIGTRITARGSFGFSSFTMRDGYSLATMPLNTPAAAANSRFIANKGVSQYNGVFAEVFPERGNNDVDRNEFWVARTGELWLRSITWSGVWVQVQGVACYRGPQNQTVMVGWVDFPGWGPDFYTFLVQGVAQ